MSNLSMVRPPFLHAGDEVRFIAPAKFAPKPAIEHARLMVEVWGLKVSYGVHMFDQWHQFAATDEHRLHDLQEALDDEQVSAIFCVRGGYGCSRIIDQVRFDRFVRNPKWLVGFSDITLLHHALLREGVQSLHATMPLLFVEQGYEAAVASLRDVLFGESRPIEGPGHNLNRTGTVSGKLAGGNLTMLCHQLGSATEVDLKGAILFLEDVGEAYYQLDRMLWQLKRAAKFHELGGLIVGGFTEMEDQNPSFGVEPYEMIDRMIHDLDIPVAYDWPCGHQARNFALVQGAQMKLEVTDSRATLSYLEDTTR